jgi:hypothetical protein
MKIVVRHPNGIERTFEGTDEELTKAADLIPGFVDGFRVGQPARADTPPGETPEDETGERSDGEEGGGEALYPEALDPAQLHARFSEVNATTDIERVTVLAQAAVDAGMEGLDYETVADLYRKLGLRMPGKWRSTFSNAQNRGYIYSVGRGKWKPTPAGYNLARLGEKQTRRRGGRSPRPPAAQASLTGNNET